MCVECGIKGKLTERHSSAIRPGLMPGIHVFLSGKQDVEGRDKPGHDESKIWSS